MIRIFFAHMKIMLAYISGASSREDLFISQLPTGLCYLHASLLKSGFDAWLANFSAWKPADIAGSIAAHKPDIIGISQWTHNRHAALELARLARKTVPTCRIVLGGGHASFRYRELLEREAAVDAVVIGEGERTLEEMARCLASGNSWDDLPGIAFRKNGQVVVNPPAPLLEDLDSLPSPHVGLDRSLGVDVQQQAEFIITARGCPAACHFCASPAFWNRKLRFRSPRQIVDEIRAIRERYGLIYFSLRDDTFTADRQRAIEFCRLLIDSRLHIVWNCQSRVTALDEELLSWMKRAGCECVQLGVESGSPRILEYLGKRITPEQVMRAAAMVRRVGISLSIYLISDIPQENETDVQATIALIRQIRPDDGYVSPLAYFPGTYLFDQAAASGQVARDIFEHSREVAVYAMGRRGVNTRRVLKDLTRYANHARPDFSAQKKLLGYCHATNIICGERHLREGRFKAAEAEYREIICREADNPWGWYLLAELQEEQGQTAHARDSYRQVLQIVPRHAPSRTALERLG